MAEAKRSLVVYFSVEGEQYGGQQVERGNTAKLADILSELTGADQFEIKPVKPYPTDYDSLLSRAQTEKTMARKVPYQGAVENFQSYERVYVCYPNWCGDMPQIVLTFLDEQDCSGQEIAPIVTSGGSGFGTSLQTLEQICKGAKCTEGLEVRGKDCQDNAELVKEQLQNWIQKL